MKTIDLTSITSLPGIIDAQLIPERELEHGRIRVECGPEAVLSMLPGRMVDASTKDENGYFDVILDIGPLRSGSETQK